MWIANLSWHICNTSLHLALGEHCGRSVGNNVRAMGTQFLLGYYGHNNPSQWEVTAHLGINKGKCFNNIVFIQLWLILK